MKNPELNQLMAEMGSKKIGFLRQVETNYLDKKKLDLIESAKVKANEHDERILNKQKVVVEGKVHEDVFPVAI